MKKILLFSLSLTMAFIGIGQPYKIPATTNRILFLGNSITYSGQYVSYIEAYIKLNSKNDDIEFMNLGLPSETVSGLSEPNHADGKFPRPDLHERLHRILSKTKPDLVFACYGMNDGIYLPFDSSRFKKYQDGMRWLHDTITAISIPIVFFTPPVYDERKGKEYAAVLDKYSEWLLSTRNTKAWQVIDIHFPMKSFLNTHRSLDPDFKYAEDGVHPDATGHWIMARSVLAGLGYKLAVNANNATDAFSAYRNGKEMLHLIEQRQSTMKNAWLTYTGHKRPMMPIGLPISTARIEARPYFLQIQQLLSHHKYSN